MYAIGYTMAVWKLNFIFEANRVNFVLCYTRSWDVTGTFMLA